MSATSARRRAALVTEFDALLVDLDGTLVLAGQPIEHAAEVMTRAREAGARPVVVTNNASRHPATVAAHLADLGMPFDAADVVSSPLAAATLLAASLPTGAPVLILGADALADAIADAGLTPVRSADDEPVAVVQGYSPDIGWRDLAEACIAIRAGAQWVATNSDTTLPTDRGLLPGNGALIQALVAATDQHPTVAGKPERPLLDAAVQRCGATRPLVVGDRLTTDIAAAVAAGIPSLMVLTGVSTIDDVLRLAPQDRPDHIGTDLRGLVDPDRCVTVADYDDDPALRAALRTLPPR